MSVTRFLLDVLPRPVYYTLPSPDDRISDAGVVQVPGKRHESLAEAREVLRRFGFDITNMPLILAVLRNPYAMEVSRYAYLQNGYTWDAGHNQDLALNESFETFALKSVDHAHVPLQEFFLLDGSLPGNMLILRTERLEEDLWTALQNTETRLDAQLPMVNSSRHDAYTVYYTEVAEEAVYERYRWVFDQGFYQRMSSDQLRSDTSERLPLEGPVVQVGRPDGFFADGWIGDELRFSVKAGRPLSDVRIEGWFPKGLQGQADIAVQLVGKRGSTAVHTGRHFSAQFPVNIPPHETLEVLVGSSVVWRPTDRGAEDCRSLSFRISSIRFS